MENPLNIADFIAKDMSYQSTLAIVPGKKHLYLNTHYYAHNNTYAVTIVLFVKSPANSEECPDLIKCFDKLEPAIESYNSY